MMICDTKSGSFGSHPCPSVYKFCAYIAHPTSEVGEREREREELEMAGSENGELSGQWGLPPSDANYLLAHN